MPEWKKTQSNICPNGKPKETYTENTTVGKF
jgi:hypothetical protein